ncbi:hypothetical protein GCM10010295_58780 [Streptomyces intermedius]
MDAGAGQGGVDVAGAHRAGVVGDAAEHDGGALFAWDASFGPSGVDAELIGQFLQRGGGNLERARRPRVGHGSTLQCGLRCFGVISVWHGGERTGRTPPVAK